MKSIWSKLEPPERRFILLIGVLALGLRLIYALQVDLIPENYLGIDMDAVEYDYLGWSIAQGNGVVTHFGDPTSIRFPGYLYFLGLSYFIFGHASVTRFLNNVADEQRRNDCFEILKMMKQVTKEEPKMWGSSIVGFGSYHYRGRSGREGDWMLTGFSPRRQNLTLYLMGGFDTHAALLKKLGKCTTSVGCLYIKTLDDVDKKVLKELVEASVKRTRQLST